MRRLASFAFLVCLAGCRNTPAEPVATPHASIAVPPTAYRPALETLAPRLAAAADASPSRVLDLRRLELTEAPVDIDVVAWRDESDRWHAAAIERDQVSVGLAGAERIHARLVAMGQTPSAAALTRIIGALHYYPWRVFDGSDWTGSPIASTPPGPGATPVITQRPGGTGRTLVFSYVIPEGTPGAGVHLANIHVTDSGYLIDAAPNPERR